jgi:hypothetical protein
MLHKKSQNPEKISNLARCFGLKKIKNPAKVAEIACD